MYATHPKFGSFKEETEESGDSVAQSKYYLSNQQTVLNNCAILANKLV